MHPAKNGTLSVPGANLYYEIRGSGPLLLMLQGGDGDASGSDGIARHLVDRFTVLTYDRRGLSRSKIEDSSEPIRLETHSDDAHRLLEALTSESAFLFGGSLGALLGLDLVARHPEQIRLLVAHEAPAPELLPEQEQAQAVAGQERMEAVYEREGAAVAVQNMMALARMDVTDREPDLELPRPTPQRTANMEFFLAHDAGAVRRYRLNLPALLVSRNVIVPAAGYSSGGAWTHHCAVALAGLLGTQCIEFPGGHNGYMLHPRAFAAKLIEVLGERADS